MRCQCLGVRPPVRRAFEIALLSIRFLEAILWCQHTDTDTDKDADTQAEMRGKGGRTNYHFPG